MGVDTSNKDFLSYCLVREIDGLSTVIILNTMNNEDEFQRQVENLSKYFNATIIKEVTKTINK
jgi:hypothetical protein